MIKAVLFDFGGVLAEEGFREGLKAIAQKQHKDPVKFYSDAESLIFETGYVTGKAKEADYWRELRAKTGLKGSDRELREEILKRFVLRKEMIQLAQRVQDAGLISAILSDQTNWLDELERRTHFSGSFDYIFNSYILKTSKRDPAAFLFACKVMGVKPWETVFVDDNKGNIERAAGKKFRTILFTDVRSTIAKVEEVLSAAPKRGQR